MNLYIIFKQKFQTKKTYQFKIHPNKDKVFLAQIASMLNLFYKFFSKQPKRELSQAPHFNFC